MFSDSELVQSYIFIKFLAIIARVKHLFPFRTEKLRPYAPMVLHGQLCGRVGHRQDLIFKPSFNEGFLFLNKFVVYINCLFYFYYLIFNYNNY